MLRRHRNLFYYALDCLRKYKTRTFVVIIAFTIAISMLSSILFLKDGLEREAEISVSLAPDITVQYLKGGRLLLLPVSYIDKASEIKGVVKVLPRIWGYAGIGLNTYTVMGLDLSDVEVYHGLSSLVKRGRFLTAEDSGTGSIVIGELLAGVLKVDVGDTVILLSESIEANRFTVIGIFSSETTIYTADLIVMSMEDARRFFRIPEGYVTDMIVYVDPEVPVDNVATELSMLPNSRVLTQDILLRGYKAAYGGRGGFLVTFWVILLSAVALICFSQATIVGRESRFEVGLLKTFGFTTLDIIEIRLIESLILGTFSASLGMIIGIIYDIWFKAGIFAQALLGWAFLPAEFHMPVYVSFPSVFSLYAVTVLPLLFATTVPAWLNAITDPELAMRRAAV
jgi:putative ABC transport system permease protein